MDLIRALMYITAATLLFLAAFGAGAGRVNLALIGAGCFVCAFALPTIAEAG